MFCQIICLSRFKSSMLWCTLRCPRKNDVRFVFITICFVGSSCFIKIFVFIYWCPTRFLYQMMFVSFNGNTTGVTSGTGTSNPSGAPQFTSCFCGVRVDQSLVFCEVFSW